MSTALPSPPVARAAKRTRRVLAFALLLLAAAVIVPSAHAADPIEGAWGFRGGVVVVRADRGAFTGIVRRDMRFAVCPHRRGERMWRIFKGTGYSGRHLSFDDRIPGCSVGDRVFLPASFKVTKTTLHMRVARLTGTRPGACGATTVCFTLRRLSPPPPAPPPTPPPSTKTALTIAVDAAPVSGAATVGAGYERSSVSVLADIERTPTKATARGSVDLVHDFTGQGSKVVSLDVTGIVGTTLQVVVTGSELASCRKGARGTLQYRDATPDRVEVRVCGWSLVFRGGGDSRVDVDVRRR